MARGQKNDRGAAAMKSIVTATQAEIATLIAIDTTLLRAQGEGTLARNPKKTARKTIRRTLRRIPRRTPKRAITSASIEMTPVPAEKQPRDWGRERKARQSPARSSEPDTQSKNKDTN
jgi:hypothetical protein